MISAQSISPFKSPIFFEIKISSVMAARLLLSLATLPQFLLFPS